MSGRMHLAMTVPDSGGVPRLRLVRLDWDVDMPCGALGQPVVPGGLGYRCSIGADHRGAHEAWVDGLCVDSWIGEH